MSDQTTQTPGRGQGMTEFALVLPLLLMLLVGIFEFGRIMFSYSVAIAASREAARYGAAIQDIGGGIAQFEDCQGIREAAKRFGKFAGIGDSEITIQYFNDGGVHSTSCPPSQDIGLADSISVRVDTAVTPFALFGDFGQIPITSSSSRTILSKVTLGESGTGAGSISGALTDVNFKTTNQSAIETQGTISVVLELNQPATDLVTIPFATTGTATKNVDYTLSSSPVTISAGQQTVTIYITLLNDGIAEGDESLFIGIETPTNATKGPQDIHMVTIQDPPLVSFATSSSTRSEGDGTVTLSITLSNAINQDVTIPIVSGGSASWGSGGDYLTIPQPVLIPAGELSTNLVVKFFDDLIDENDEIAALGLGTPVNALLGSIPMHLMTIQDNDDPPGVQFYAANVIVSEEIGFFATTISLDNYSSKVISVPYTISGTTTAGDYVIHETSPVVIPPGNISADITMDILEGDGWEEDETLVLTLGTPTNAVLGSPAEQTIVITESSLIPDVSLVHTSQKITEGDILVGVMVQLSNAWSQDVVVPFAISGTAGQGFDYSLPQGSLTIPVGYTQGFFTVQITEDNLNEGDETIVLTMGSVTNGNPTSPTQHTITIEDDDSPPEVSFVGSSLKKVESAGPFQVSINLDKTHIQDVTVPLVLSGTASSTTDYTIADLSLTIGAGLLSASTQISLVDDAVFEADETLIIELGSPTNGVRGSNDRFTVTIEDDELPLCEVGTHMLTVGSDLMTWSITNQGEGLILTGASITWPEASSNQPRLLSIQFDGNPVWSGSEKPTSFSCSAWENFSELDTAAMTFSFDGPLGAGNHQLQAFFQNPSDGSTCSLVENYTGH